MVVCFQGQKALEPVLDYLLNRSFVAEPGDWWTDESFATECGYCMRNHILGSCRDEPLVAVEVSESGVGHDDDEKETTLPPSHLAENVDEAVLGGARRVVSPWCLRHH